MAAAPVAISALPATVVEDTIVEDTEVATLEARVKALEAEAAKNAVTIQQLIAEYQRLGQAQRARCAQQSRSHHWGIRDIANVQGRQGEEEQGDKQVATQQSEE
jgi:uncharacterized protein YcaQ